MILHGYSVVENNNAQHRRELENAQVQMTGTQIMVSHFFSAPRVRLV